MTHTNTLKSCPGDFSSVCLTTKTTWLGKYHVLKVISYNIRNTLKPLIFLYISVVPVPLNLKGENTIYISLCIYYSQEGRRSRFLSVSSSDASSDIPVNFSWLQLTSKVCRLLLTFCNCRLTVTLHFDNISLQSHGTINTHINQHSRLQDFLRQDSLMSSCDMGWSWL